jgi:hypothetical protein
MTVKGPLPEPVQRFVDAIDISAWAQNRETAVEEMPASAGWRCIGIRGQDGTIIARVEWRVESVG